MKKVLVLIPIVIILSFCSRYFVFKKHIEKLNPMTYIYICDIDKVRGILNEMFSNGKFHGLDFELGYNLIEKENNKITDNENRNHFFINWVGLKSSGENSKIYYNWWGKLKLIPSYHIILDSLPNSQTKITIESFPIVEAGTDFSLNHMLPYVTSRKVNVKPSTIEEYEIIRMIGERCGEKNMPMLIEK